MAAGWFRRFVKAGAGPEDGESFTSPRIHLGSDIVVPDWAGWRRARGRRAETPLMLPMCYALPSWKLAGRQRLRDEGVVFA